MALVQLLQIEYKSLKDALEASEKKSDRDPQLGAFGHRQSANRTG